VKKSLGKVHPEILSSVLQFIIKCTDYYKTVKYNHIKDHFYSENKVLVSDICYLENRKKETTTNRLNTVSACCLY